MFAANRTLASRIAAGLAIGLTSLAAAGVQDVCNPRLIYTLPDLDQRRTAAPGISGLPWGGAQHCVPTCTMNIFRYLANHGYPQLDPGSGPWVGGPALYEEMTDAIALLGSPTYMNTAPTSDTGTSGTNALIGINEWFEDTGTDDDIVVSLFGTTANNAPELGDIALCFLVNRPLSMSVGWYQRDAQNFSIIRRQGGHCVGPVRLPGFCGPFKQISIRDPGNGGTTTTQQAGTTESYSINTQNVQVRDNTTNDLIYSGPLEAMIGYASSGRVAFIDAIRIFSPRFGIAACNNPVNGVCVNVVNPNLALGAELPQIPCTVPGLQLIDLDIHPTNTRFVALTSNAAGGRDAYMVRVDGQTVSPIALPGSPKAVIMTDYNEAVSVDASDFILWRSTFGPNASSTPASSPFPIHAICYDARRDEVVALSRTARRIIRFDADTLAIVSNREIPSVVPIGAQARMSVCPKSNNLYIASGVSGVYSLDDSATGLSLAAVMSTGTSAPHLGVDVDNRGHVFTNVAGQIVEFQPNATFSGGVRVAVGDLDGTALASAGGLFKIARSHSNLERIHDSRDWTDAVLPTDFAPSIPDCPADFNLDQVVNINDIFDFLNAWFANQQAADFNENLTLGVDDIFAFLNAWFAGC